MKIFKSNNKMLNSISRRQFVKIAGIAPLLASTIGCTKSTFSGISIVIDRSDAIAGSAPAQWAVGELSAALVAVGIRSQLIDSPDMAAPGDLVLFVSGANMPLAEQWAAQLDIKVPQGAESLALIPAISGDQHELLACGTDANGLVYALLELADRVKYADNPFESLQIQSAIVEYPANKIRANGKLFVSELEDKPWFYDHDGWQEYLTMLATQRFNRFALHLGIGYDFLKNVTDAYFVFAYPFLLDVPGYHVRVPEITNEERDKNLQMLQFISEQTVARGMRFQLGLWMHAYEWLASPNPDHTIKGITPQNHGPYSRDALRLLLQKCPHISGVTIRTHGESGVTEDSLHFWKTVFDGVATCGRKVEIDMHAKGMHQRKIDMALATKQPVIISPKYWAEHVGLPYHQAEIMDHEIPKKVPDVNGLMKYSEGSRSFIRYGYGDLLREDREFGVLIRVWNGTQRMLLWGDPEWNAAHAKAFSFCGSNGVELMEPLAFKGRRGSGRPGGRCAYQDESLKPERDWQKFLYSYRVFGRLIYNPDTDPDVWRRFLDQRYGRGAKSVEAALTNASRILPTVLTVHCASAANNHFWPELETNYSIVDPNQENPYFDSPSPKVFGNVSPLDPQLFYRINDFASDLLKGERSGKYTPVEYAQWIEDYSAAALEHLATAKKKTSDTRSPEFRRMALDVFIQAGLGQFYAAKFRAGLLYGIYDQSGDSKALELAVQWYKQARDHWADVANKTKGVYQDDITLGELDFQHGHWLDRIPLINADIALMETKLAQAPADKGPQPEQVKNAIQEALGRPARADMICRHTQPEKFKIGVPLTLELTIEQPVASVRMYYRQVNQAVRHQSVEMEKAGNTFKAAIPADYTNTQYPLQYYFEIKKAANQAWLYPGFNDSLSNQPYYVVRSV